MRKELTAISAFSAIIAFTAGIVLCMQVSHITSPGGSEISGTVLWIAEIALFGTAVLAWRRRVSFGGWLIGIAGLAVMRVGLVSGAAMVLALMRESADMGSALSQVSALVPRLCAVGFSLMVGYPFRVFLPLRPAEGQRRAFKDSPAAKVNGLDDSDRGLLIVTVKDRTGGADSSRGEAKIHTAGGFVSTAPMVEGDVELSLSTMLALMPENLITDRALALSDVETMTIPLEVILPQLKEAQVVFSVSELRSWIPLSVRKALVQPSDSDIETENGLVSVPLNLIVPQVPVEALELPPPSPPAWAKVDAEERVVFATV